MTAHLVMKHLSSTFAVPGVQSDRETFVFFMMQGLEFINLVPAQTSELIQLCHPGTFLSPEPPWDQGWGWRGEGWPCPPVEAAPLPDEGEQLLLKRGWSHKE